MRKSFASLFLATLIGLPSLAWSQDINFTTELGSLYGGRAYVAIYITDNKGTYQRTLWVAGHKSRYYRHLRDWVRGTGMNSNEYDGLTGASLIGNRPLKVTVNVDAKLIDAGYQVRIDSAMEDDRENRAEVIAPLTHADAGKVFTGSGYVTSFSYQF